MNDFSAITVVSVTGLQSVASGAMLSIMHSMKNLPGSEGLLISPDRPGNMPDWISHVSIKSFSYFEYSLFVLYALGKFIRTEFALVVQDDGWVLNADNWRKEFFNYDYIGAPIHLARITQANQTFFQRDFQWLEYLGQANCRIENIYNGGFSLRSKRFLDAPRKLRLEFAIPIPDVSPEPPHTMYWKEDLLSEDVWLCLIAREKLEADGLVFPSLHIARDFSIEHAAPSLHSSETMQNIFGHHSRMRKINNLNPKELTYNIKSEQLDGIYGENWLVEIFKENGYKINWQN